MTSRKPIVPKLLSNKRPETREIVQEQGKYRPKRIARLFARETLFPAGHFWCCFDRTTQHLKVICRISDRFCAAKTVPERVNGHLCWTDKLLEVCLCLKLKLNRTERYRYLCNSIRAVAESKCRGGICPPCLTLTTAPLLITALY